MRRCSRPPSSPNASSSLLPVSNLTNLLVFSATGLTFGGFAVRMALPTLAAASVVVGTAVRSDGDDRPAPPDPAVRPVRLDGVRLVRASPRSRHCWSRSSSGPALGLEPAWIAVVGAAVVGGRGGCDRAGPARPAS